MTSWFDKNHKDVLTTVFLDGGLTAKAVECLSHQSISLQTGPEF